MKYYGRNMVTGQYVSGDKDNAKMFLRSDEQEIPASKTGNPAVSTNKAVTKSNYWLKTYQGRLSYIVDGTVRVRQDNTKYMRIDEKAAGLVKKFLETGNRRFLDQAERMMS